MRRLQAFALKSLFGGLFLSLWASGVGAQEVGDPVAGQRFAMNLCAECHMVAVGQSGLYRADAPPFPDLAMMPSTTALSLRVFLQTPHAKRNMPDLVLTETQMDNVIAYILSLRQQ